MAYRLRYSETCRRQIAALHPQLKAIVRSRLDHLRSMPYAGKGLERELAGYRSFRANGFGSSTVKRKPKPWKSITWGTVYELLGECAAIGR